MSEAFLNQITLDCLLNKKMYNTHLRSKKIKEQNKEERKFYRKRSFNLFKEIITGNEPKDLPPDVKYAYDNFINTTIHYFKTIDNNDIIQLEYKDIDIPLQECNENYIDISGNLASIIEADKLLLRSIKINAPTLDKYVKKTTTKKKEDDIILPKQKEINLNNPELKNKGLKKNNINNIYEDKNTKKEKN